MTYAIQKYIYETIHHILSLVTFYVVFGFGLLLFFPDTIR